MRRPVLSVCAKGGGTSPHTEGGGGRRGVGGARRQRHAVRGGGGMQTQFAYPLPLCIPLFACERAHKGGRVLTMGEEEGSGKRVVPPSHASPWIHVDALFTCYLLFCFCLFIFTLF